MKKVLLEKGVWIADQEGDPGRTIREENAKEFPNMKSALRALKEAREYRPFEKAEVIEDFF